MTCCLLDILISSSLPCSGHPECRTSYPATGDVFIFHFRVIGDYLPAYSWHIEAFTPTQASGSRDNGVTCYNTLSVFTISLAQLSICRICTLVLENHLDGSACLNVAQFVVGGLPGDYQDYPAIDCVCQERLDRYSQLWPDDVQLNVIRKRCLLLPYVLSLRDLQRSCVSSAYVYNTIAILIAIRYAKAAPSAYH
jgi:hypothetical protein